MHPFNRICIAFLAPLAAVPSFMRGQAPAPLVQSARVDHLLSQMTLAEKISMLHGSGEDAATYQGEAGYLAGIPRLGIPPMRFADGPPGILTRVPSIAPPSTMDLASAFSRVDARLIGTVIGREARSHGISVALQPFINLNRALDYDRGYNTFGEDPFLTGQLGAAEITGIQSKGVLAQAKHFVGYDTNATDVEVDDQALHEIYLAPFAAAVQAGVASVMCSYNHINGPYACGNAHTLNDLLRREIGFQGFVTSDWGAMHATDFINAGADLEMSGPLPVPWKIPSYFVNANPSLNTSPDAMPEGRALTDRGLPEEPVKPPYAPSTEPLPTTNLAAFVAEGKVKIETIDQSVKRILLQMERFGLLDDKSRLAVTPSDNREDVKVIEQVAIDGAVLLKNEGGLLPLSAASLSNLAMIGSNASQVVAVGLTGEKAVGLPSLEVGPLAALQHLKPDARVAYAAADDMDGHEIPARFLSHDGEPGLERRMWRENAVSHDATLNFTQAGARALPANADAVWTGTLTVPESGTYRLHLQLKGCYGKLKIDDQVIAKTWFNWIHGEVTQAGQDNIFPTTDGLDNLRAAVPLTAGSHVFRVEVEPDTSNAPVEVRVSWVTPSEQKRNYDAAIEAARHASVAVVFAWSRTRPIFALPGDQDQLIRDIAAVNPNTIVVLNVSQPIALPWLPQVKAVLQMNWPGDMGGWATAKLLLGNESPGGKLPFTWPVRRTDEPADDPKHPERTLAGVNGKTVFSEGLLVGYRWFDKQRIMPQFPFGFGLSYTSFSYSDLQISRVANGDVALTVQIRNTGAVLGDEVVQVYLDQPAHAPPGVAFAQTSLCGFLRVRLKAGEAKKVSITIPSRQFQYWSTAKSQWMFVTGARSVSVGGSSRDRRLTAVLQ